MKEKVPEALRWLMHNNMAWVRLVEYCNIPKKKDIDKDVISKFIAVDKSDAYKRSYRISKYSVQSDAEMSSHVYFSPNGIGVDSIFEMEGISFNEMEKNMCDMMLRNMLVLDGGKISMKNCPEGKPFGMGKDSDLERAGLLFEDRRRDTKYISKPSIKCDIDCVCGIPSFIPFGNIGLDRTVSFNLTHGIYDAFDSILFISSGISRAEESGLPFNPNMVDISDLTESTTLSGIILNDLKSQKHKLLNDGHLKYQLGCVDNFGMFGGMSLILKDPSFKLRSCKNFPERVQEIMILQDLYDIEDMTGFTKDIGNLVLDRVKLNDSMEIPSGIHVRGNVRFIDVDPKFAIRIAKSDMQIDGIIVSEYYSGTKEHLLELIDKYGWDDRS